MFEDIPAVPWYRSEASSGDLFFQVILVSLAQATVTYTLSSLPRRFQFHLVEDRIDALFLRLLDKSTGIHDHDIVIFLAFSCTTSISLARSCPLSTSLSTIFLLQPSVMMFTLSFYVFLLSSRKVSLCRCSYSPGKNIGLPVIFLYRCATNKEIMSYFGTMDLQKTVMNLQQLEAHKLIIYKSAMRTARTRTTATTWPRRSHTSYGVRTGNSAGSLFSPPGCTGWH